MRRLILPLIILSGCATVSIKGVSVLEESWTEALDQVRPKAAFEFQCPEAKLHLTILTTKQYLDGVAPTSIGVRGCGKQATWVRLSRKGVNTWLAESAARPVDAD
jgi:hypothetical protein